MYIHYYFFILFMFSKMFSKLRNNIINTSVVNRLTTTMKISQHQNDHYIINKKDNRVFYSYEQNSFLEKNPHIKNKKIITLSPGGYYGFYTMGISAYIKKHYNLSDYVFSGASAGAWNSLLMTSKRTNLDEFKDFICHEDVANAKTIAETEELLKRKILQRYTTNDFELEKLFIGITNIIHRKPYTIIYTGFTDLEDAIDCCIASSHIPLITGNLTHIYHNLLSFDGGFSKYPYLNITPSVLHITPSIWRKRENITNNRKLWKNIHDYTTFFSKENYDFIEMFDNGYADAEKHKTSLDNVFGKENEL